ncbi:MULTISPECIES: hypothetical protein [Streptomyces]|uniref:hypothetical protein n=1 Tax=Streptomyces TaxID=1883 RepID=UPI0014889618|nr:MULTISPECIES: hypothetical protein [Streptomyces]
MPSDTRITQTVDEGPEVTLYVVEGRWTAAAASLAKPVTALARRDRDDRPDPAFAQVFADDA